MMSHQEKIALELALGGLLGFDDGASDVLDHLLTIESEDDLLEYLSQLLGDATPTILDFVDNVGHFNRGEPLTLEIKEPLEIMQQEMVLKHTAKQNTTSMLNELSTSQTSNAPGQKATLQSGRNQKQNKSRVPPPKKKHSQQQHDRTKSATIVEERISETTSSVVEVSTTPTSASGDNIHGQKGVETSRPKSGQAKTVCGCFGTKHQALTNCLYCGRISCDEEGYDFCPFCGLMVEDVKDGIHDGDKAWVQKERLLRFDREFARRTEIFDDQADYQGPSTWMTAEERDQAEANQKKQLEALKRPKQVLNFTV